MRKIIIIIVLIIIVFFIALFVYFYPSLNPVLGPPPEDISQLLPQGNNNLNQPLTAKPVYPILEKWQYVDHGPLTILGNLQIEVFAENFKKPRVLLFDQKGNLLVSAMNEGSIYAIQPDQTKIKLISGLNNPHGLELKLGYLYIAETNGVSRYAYDEDDLMLGPAEKLFALPDDGGHNTRTIKFGQDNNLYVAVGSSCNVCQEKDERRSAILKYDPQDWSYEIFAKSLRNTVFFIEHPQTKEFWGNDMGRDLLGDNLPPDELNIIKANQDYGWPICYGNKIHDTNFDKNTYIRNPCEDTIGQVFGYPAHNSPLGLVLIDSPIFPKEWQGDILVALHGSWNRSVPDGYKVVHLRLEGDKVIVMQDFLTGFLTDKGAIGRPVDLVFGPDQALYLSDDKAGVIYRIY
ncbi:PQQ-dependent sugar dehydrogenase [Patescibacteria group bacterium]